VTNTTAPAYSTEENLPAVALLSVHPPKSSVGVDWGPEALAVDKGQRAGPSEPRAHLIARPCPTVSFSSEMLQAKVRLIMRFNVFIRHHLPLCGLH
jgi:hypothetical protein